MAYRIAAARRIGDHERNHVDACLAVYMHGIGDGGRVAVAELPQPALCGRHIHHTGEQRGITAALCRHGEVHSRRRRYRYLLHGGVAAAVAGDGDEHHRVGARGVVAVNGVGKGAMVGSARAGVAEVPEVTRQRLPRGSRAHIGELHGHALAARPMDEGCYRLRQYRHRLADSSRATVGSHCRERHREGAPLAIAVRYITAIGEQDRL